MIAFDGFCHRSLFPEPREKIFQIKPKYFTCFVFFGGQRDTSLPISGQLELENRCQRIQIIRSKGLRIYQRIIKGVSICHRRNNATNKINDKLYI